MQKYMLRLEWHHHFYLLSLALAVVTKLARTGRQRSLTVAQKPALFKAEMSRTLDSVHIPASNFGPQSSTCEAERMLVLHRYMCWKSQTHPGYAVGSTPGLIVWFCLGA